jgi:outer membrane biogenesis lipoprotein LolB
MATRRAELERRLGVALPLAELRWWLLGIPAPGETAVNQDAGTAKSTTSCRPGGA